MVLTFIDGQNLFVEFKNQGKLNELQIQNYPGLTQVPQKIIISFVCSQGFSPDECYHSFLKIGLKS